MMKQLAKNSGITIQKHSEIVKIVSEELSKKILPEEVFNDFVETISISSLLHDIGKLTKEFQDYIDGTKSRIPKFFHNEIGWAFLSKYVKKDFKNKNIILYCIYWHHGISNKINKHSDCEILETLSKQELENMKSYLISVIGEDNINLEIDDEDMFSPIFYDATSESKSEMPKKTLLLNILITGDRVGSSYNCIEKVVDIKKKIDDIFSIDINDCEDYRNCKFHGNERFKEQQKIENDIVNNSTIIKAPAGFGKTMLGLMWSLKIGKKILWVTPRNTIAESVYLSIIDDLKNLGVNASVQLLLTGEVKKSNKEVGLYESDIIVTNIDNFIAPHIKSNLMINSTMVNHVTVIFDEFHEFLTRDAYFSIFVNIMKIRHNYTMAKTLLLSATNVNINFLWEGLKKTHILPCEESHYNAAHKIKYKIKIENNSDLIDVENNSSTLFITNSIKNSQELMRTRKFSKLIHSNFKEDSKKESLTYLIDKFGKNSEYSTKKENIVGTQVLEAAIDMSFNKLIEHTISHLSSLQRIGRCCRFGKLKNPEIYFSKPNNNMMKSDEFVKDILWDSDLSDKWFNYVREFSKELMTLDELYVLYNSFSKIEENHIKKFIKKNYRDSLLKIGKIYPIRFNNKSKKTDIKTAGSNKLRSSSTEIFYIVKHISEDKWVGPFTMSINEDFTKQFKETSKTIEEIKKNLKSISNSDEYEYIDYSEIVNNKYKLKNLTLDMLRYHARKSNKPYLAFNMFYDDKLGIVKN